MGDGDRYEKNIDNMEKKCLVCGDTFYKKPSCSLKKWNTIKKFCSKICHDKSMLGHIPWNKGVIYSAELKARLDVRGLSVGRAFFKGKEIPQMQGKNNPAWIKPIPVVCAHCSKEILLKPWQMKDRKRFFCNRTCWSQGTRGKGSPVFKGEAARKKLRHRIMELPEYPAWRMGVFSRDSFKCVWCGSKVNIEADHIKTFALIVRENKIINCEQARNCKELWNLENGRTLCRKCHRTTITYMKHN